ncbi:MAG TPA: adenine phosphoribosyltransferase [Myxococcota bacterium]|nr:adenine phosphoribosyltransferase [Myxococcota bacterium]HQK52483.1 adenine phosphoribosyltransferase [Myxococcota bacterium]
MKDAELAQALGNRIRDVPDFPKPGILFKDITPVLLDAPLYGRVVEALATAVRDAGTDVVMGIESRGYLFAAPVAARLGLPLALVRKPGKLPWRTRAATYDLEYGTDRIEVHEDAVQPGQRVAVIDDLLATGGTMEAACRLVRDLGGAPVLAAFVVELSFLPGRQRLGNAVDAVESLVVF